MKVFLLVNDTHAYKLGFIWKFFSDKLPVEIGNMLRLEELKLAKNSISGVIPNDFIELKNLTSLNTSNNIGFTVYNLTLGVKEILMPVNTGSNLPCPAFLLTYFTCHCNTLLK